MILRQEAAVEDLSDAGRITDHGVNVLPKVARRSAAGNQRLQRPGRSRVRGQVRAVQDQVGIVEVGIDRDSENGVASCADGMERADSGQREIALAQADNRADNGVFVADVGRPTADGGGAELRGCG